MKSQCCQSSISLVHQDFNIGRCFKCRQLVDKSGNKTSYAVLEGQQTTPQLFRVGDRVQNRSDNVGTITEVEYRPPYRTLGAVFYGGSTTIKTVEGGGTYAYKVNGEGFHPSHWFTQAVLESAQPCPNCGVVGWDWVSGCNECGLSPEDGE